MIDGLDTPTTVAAVFDDRVNAEDFVKAVKEGRPRHVHQHLDFDRWRRAVLPRRRNQPRHSVGYSLGFEGKTEKLPNTQVLQLSDDVRSRHGQPFAREEDDRLGEGRPPHAGAGRHLYGALLLLRRV